MVIYILLDYINKEAGDFSFSPIATITNFPSVLKNSQVNRKSVLETWRSTNSLLVQANEGILVIQF